MEGCCFMNFLSSRIRENEIVLGSRIIISVDLLHKLGCSVRLWDNGETIFSRRIVVFVD